MNNSIKLDIPIWTIVKVLLVIVGFYILFSIRDIIALFFVVLILTASFMPTVNHWEKKIGRLASVLILFVMAIFLLVLVGYLIVPPIVEQSKQLTTALPDFLNRLEFLKKYLPDVSNNVNSISDNIGKITGSFVSVTANIFGGFVTFFMAIIMTIYLLLDRDGVSSVIRFIVPTEKQAAVIEVAKKVSLKVGSWFRGQIFLGLIIAVLDLIGLSIIGAPYALTLAVISGILEFIPTIGPLIAGVIAVLVTLADSPVKALFVIILYAVVQQLENSFIVPKVMQKAVGLSPVIIILAILVGAKLLGLIGAIIAVPLAASIAVVIQEWPSIKNGLKNNG